MNTTSNFLIALCIVLSCGACQKKITPTKLFSQEIIEIPEPEPEPEPEPQLVEIQEEIPEIIEIEQPEPQQNDEPPLKKYNIVVGSFNDRANADRLLEDLIKDGNNALVSTNKDGMFRVIIDSFDNRAPAIKTMQSARKRFRDAWIFIAE